MKIGCSCRHIMVFFFFSFSYDSRVVHWSENDKSWLRTPLKIPGGGGSYISAFWKCDLCRRIFQLRPTTLLGPQETHPLVVQERVVNPLVSKLQIVYFVLKEWLKKLIFFLRLQKVLKSCLKSRFSATPHVKSSIHPFEVRYCKRKDTYFGVSRAIIEQSYCLKFHDSSSMTILQRFE